MPTSLPTASTPQFLQLINWILRPLDLMDHHAQRYGDLFRLRASRLNWVMVSHPDALKQLLTRDAQEFGAPGELNRILKPLLGENSVILLGGEAHRQRRQLIMPPFHGERLKAYADLIQAITREVMAEIPAGSRFLARDTMQQITMRVILEAVFGLHDGERYRRLEVLLRDRLNMSSNPLASTLIFFPFLRKNVGSWSPGAKLEAMAQETDALIFEEIRERRANLDPDRTDILSLLLAARDEAGQGLTDQELRDELMTLLVAGHETTATAITWALYWVHQLPEVRQQLLDELATAGAGGDALAYTKLPYLNAVCNETLRIYPVAMLTFPRRVEQPVDLMGYALEPGDVVVGCIYLVHRREDLYPEPARFKPERFLERQFSAFEFMPFGGGSRRCVGAALAMYEMKIILGTLLSEYDFRLLETTPVRPQRRGVTLGMSSSMPMRLEGRRSSMAMQPTPALR